jgi:hypothetical protein
MEAFSAGFKQWGWPCRTISPTASVADQAGLRRQDGICLYGGSYGGYATLGVIKTPDLYNCVVAFVAVTDINLMFDITWSAMARSSYGWLDWRQGSDRRSRQGRESSDRCRR